MSLIDSASLIVTPNAYKEGKLYSVIPSDGSGDMSVVRATTATRVNSAGLVELVPYNLVSYSEQFDNAYWQKLNGATITSNSTTAPDGTLTADTLNVATSIYSGLSRVISGVSANYNVSVYAKKNTKNWLYFIDVEGVNARAWFDLDNGVLGTVASGYTATITNVGNGWYRCTLANNNAQTLGYYQLGLADANNGLTPSSSGSAFIWGAQLNEGTNALPYLKTETRLNIPRIDYSLGGCPNILLEPQRTNLALYSEQFDNAAWTKASSTITSNVAISPSGYQDADNWVGTSANLYRGGTAGVEYTISVYVKSNGQSKDNFVLRLGNSVSTTFTATSEWQRFSFTGTPTTTVFGITTASAPNNAADILVWGAQIEQASYATSYIPTTTASVTRNQDVCVKTGISSLINSAEGVLYAEIAALDLTNSLEVLSLSDGTFNNVVFFRYYDTSSNDIQVQVKVAGVVQVSILVTLTNAKDFNKIAFKYKENDFALWVNGVNVGTDISGSTFAANTLSKFAFDRGDGSNPMFANVQNLMVFPTALSDDQLEALTGTGFNTYAEMASYYNYITQ